MGNGRMPLRASSAIPTSMRIICPGRLASTSSRWLVRYFTRTRSEEHTSELQSLMRISYAVCCLKNKNHTLHHTKDRTIVQRAPILNNSLTSCVTKHDTQY